MGVPLIDLSEYSIPIFSFAFCDELTESQFVHTAVRIAEFLLYRREPVHIRVRNEFCCLHADKKIGNRCKLDAVDVFQ